MTPLEEARAKLGMRLFLRATPLLYEGRKVGRLTLLQHWPRPRRLTNSYWVCRCDCGEVVDVYTHNLKSGATSSCGCLRREVSKAKALAKNSKLRGE